MQEFFITLREYREWTYGIKHHISVISEAPLTKGTAIMHVELRDDYNVEILNEETYDLLTGLVLHILTPRIIGKRCPHNR